MSEASEKRQLAELSREQPASVDPKHLAWVEEKIAAGQKQMKNPSDRIPAKAVWEALDLKH